MDNDQRFMYQVLDSENRIIAMFLNVEDADAFANLRDPDCNELLVVRRKQDASDN